MASFADGSFFTYLFPYFFLFLYLAKNYFIFLGPIVLSILDLIGIT